MRFIFLLLLSGSLFGQTPDKSVVSLNGTWSFRTDPNSVGEQQGWFRPSVSASNWDSLPVPGNWDLRNEYAHYVGKGWYRRTFPTPTSIDGNVVRLLFEAVYHDCTVWLNGQKLGENHSGFLPFEFDITQRLSASGPNTLVVCADNSLTRGAIWNWGGIRRPVRLEITKPVRIVRQHITPTVDLTRKSATVAVRVFVQNHGSQTAEATGTLRLSAPNGVSRSLPFRVSIPAGGTASALIQTSLTPKETHLWHFDDPFLYTAQAALATGEQRVNRFGLRKIEVDNKAYTLKLNGEVIRPMGFNLVPDDRTTGNTLPTWRIREDIDLLKGMGCVMTRLSHLCLPEEVMDYLDERGMLVVSEIPLWGYDRLADPASLTAKDWLTRLITNQYNHPSVIAWSVGNEYGEFPTAMDYTRQAVAYARTLDSTRLVSCVSHTAQFPTDIVGVGDIGLINKYNKNLGPVTRLQHQMHPGKTLFYSEYGTGILGENLDTDLDARSLLDSIRNLPYLIGGSLWTFNDYRSRFFGTKEGSENRAWGVVDVYRRKKKAYYSFRQEHNPLRQMTVNAGPSSATVTLQPRRPLDLPAYPLHGYRLLWKRTDAGGKIAQSGLIPLPDIRPGDAVQRHTFNWQSNDGSTDSAFALTVELLAPTGDALADTTLFLQKPLPVEMTYALGSRSGFNGHGQGGMIRVHFRKNPTATAYKVRYGVATPGVATPGENALTQETPPTLNDYVDIPKLTLGKTYQVAVVGLNGAGEGAASNIRQITVEPIQFAPPIIQHVEPADGGFFIGYASPDDDYAYRVQVTTRPGDYASARTIQTLTPGTLFVPGLTNGQTYYFRMQRLKDNWFDTAWSEERTVTPDGGQRPAPPVLQGVVQRNSEVVVCFEPVAKATSYRLEYRADDGSWQSQTLVAAQTGRAIVTGLNPKKRYQFRLATLTEAGQSEFSSITNAQLYAQGRRNR